MVRLGGGLESEPSDAAANQRHRCTEARQTRPPWLEGIEPKAAHGHQGHAEEERPTTPSVRTAVPRFVVEGLILLRRDLDLIVEVRCLDGHLDLAVGRSSSAPC